jgi:hypothetical protein
VTSRAPCKEIFVKELPTKHDHLIQYHDFLTDVSLFVAYGLEQRTVGQGVEDLGIIQVEESVIVT